MMNANVNSEPKRALLKWFLLGSLLCVLPCSGSTFIGILIDPTDPLSMPQVVGYLFAVFGLPFVFIGLCLTAILSSKTGKLRSASVQTLRGMACGIGLCLVVGPFLLDFRLRKVAQFANVRLVVDEIEDHVLDHGVPPDLSDSLMPAYLLALRELDLGAYPIDYYTASSVPHRFEDKLIDDWVIVLADQALKLDACFYVYNADTNGWDFDFCD